MLSLHETEEINMGDKTPFDNISEAEKLQMGKVAVSKTLSNLSKKNCYLGLIMNLMVEKHLKQNLPIFVIN